MKNTYTLKEIAAICKCSVKSVRRWIDSGLKPCKGGGFGRTVKISKGDLLAFLEQSGRAVPTELAEGITARVPQADDAWERLVNDYSCGDMDHKKRAVKMLDANLQALTVLTPLERIGFLQAAGDLVERFAKMEGRS